MKLNKDNNDHVKVSPSTPETYDIEYVPFSKTKEKEKEENGKNR